MADNFFAFSQEMGFERCGTEGQAKDKANQEINKYREHAALGGWPEDAAEHVYWGMIIEESKVVMERPTTQDDACFPEIDRVIDYGLVATNDLAQSVSFDLIKHLERQWRFSIQAFGPGARTAANIDHIQKELVEITESPDNLEEWIDLMLLAFDGAMRRGFNPRDICAMLENKLTKNEKRSWPDWRTAPADKAIEHIKDEVIEDNISVKNKGLDQGKFLAGLQYHLNTQDGRCTADPFFCVFSKQQIVVDEDYDHDRIVWVDEEGNEASDLKYSRLERLCMRGRENPKWRRLAVKEVDQFETACFTEQGCKNYLAIQGHNLRKPFIYVTSLWRNDEMISLRNMLMSSDVEHQHYDRLLLTLERKNVVISAYARLIKSICKDLEADMQRGTMPDSYHFTVLSMRQMIKDDWGW